MNPEEVAVPHANSQQSLLNYELQGTLLQVFISLKGMELQ